MAGWSRGQHSAASSAALLAALCCIASVACLQAHAAAPPLPLPQSAGTSYKAAYHYVTCQADYVIEPANTQELADAITAYKALAASTGAKLKIRASRKQFHSTTSFVCPNQLLSNVAPEADAGVISVGVLHDKMNNTVAHDPAAFTMTVQAGMKLREFTAEATRLGMSAVVGTLPAYAGLTIGGVMSTSAHGSGDNATSNLCDVMISMKWVDANGDVHVSDRASPEARLLCGGLGLIGVIAEVTLQMTPPTHTKLITRYLANDTDIVGDIEQLLKVSPHILVFWRPDMRTYSAYLLKPVSADVPASDAYMSLLPSYAGHPSMASLFRDVQADIFDQKFPAPGLQASLMCPTTAVTSVGKTWASNPDGSDVLNAVGRTNELMSSECWEGCGWVSDTYNGTTDDVHLSIEFDDFRDWVTDIKSILEHDLWGNDRDKGRCLGPGYIWLRFGHGGPDFLSMHYDMKRPVYVQSTWLKSRAVLDKAPMRFGFVLDLLEEVSLCKYQGRPHWGKNFVRTFNHPRCPLTQRFPASSFDAAARLQAKHDPEKVFEPEIYTRIANNQPYELFPRCALSKDCFCEADEHCPERHRCVPSATPGLESYMVCKPDWRLVPQLGRTVADGSGPAAAKAPAAPSRFDAQVMSAAVEKATRDALQPLLQQAHKQG